MGRNSKQFYKGPKHSRDRQTIQPETSVNRNSNPSCEPGRHAFGVPESTVWKGRKSYNYYTCALCPATKTVER